MKLHFGSQANFQRISQLRSRVPPSSVRSPRGSSRQRRRTRSSPGIESLTSQSASAQTGLRMLCRLSCYLKMCISTVLAYRNIGMIGQRTARTECRQGASSADFCRFALSNTKNVRMCVFLKCAHFVATMDFATPPPKGSHDGNSSARR